MFSILKQLYFLYNSQFFKKTHKKKDKGEAKIIENSSSDHLTLLNAFQFVEKHKFKDIPSFLNTRAIKSAHEIHKQIMEYCEDIFKKLSLKKHIPDAEINFKEKNELILKCLCKGLPLNIAHKITDQDKPEETKGVCYKAKVFFGGFIFIESWNV